MIVINYRHADTGGYALYLNSELVRAFSKQRVFLDVGGDLSGCGDYTKVIFGKIEKCRVFLCLIGPNWLSATNARGLRLQDPDDLVRREIDLALQRNKAVIPVLLNGASMPDRMNLPSCISELPKIDAVSFRHERYEADAANLISAVKKALQTRPTNTQSYAPSTPLWNDRSLEGLQRLTESLATSNTENALRPGMFNALSLPTSQPPVNLLLQTLLFEEEEKANGNILSGFTKAR